MFRTNFAAQTFRIEDRRIGGPRKRKRRESREAASLRTFDVFFSTQGSTLRFVRRFFSASCFSLKNHETQTKIIGALNLLFGRSTNNWNFRDGSDFSYNDTRQPVKLLRSLWRHARPRVCGHRLRKQIIRWIAEVAAQDTTADLLRELIREVPWKG